MPTSNKPSSALTLRRILSWVAISAAVLVPSLELLPQAIALASGLRQYSEKDFASALGMPDTKFIKSGCGTKSSGSFVESCRIAPCSEPEVLKTGRQLNQGEPIIQCLVDDLPTDVCFRGQPISEPTAERENMLDELLNGIPRPAKKAVQADPRCTHRGQRIGIGRFTPGPSTMMFYVQRNGTFVPAYSYEEVSDVIGGLKNEADAAAFLQGVLGFSVHHSETKMRRLKESYVFENAFLGSPGRCNILQKMDVTVWGNGSYGIANRVLVHGMESGCPAS